MSLGPWDWWVEEHSWCGGRQDPQVGSPQLICEQVQCIGIGSCGSLGTLREKAFLMELYMTWDRKGPEGAA